MRIALVSGDGLPVSGLLTTFRNVVDIGVAESLLELPQRPPTVRLPGRARSCAHPVLAVRPAVAMHRHRLHHPLDSQGTAALTRLCRAVTRGHVEVILRSPDVLIADNRRAVHGRRAFQTSYDGTNRWPRKMTVSRDAERVRHRHSASSRRLFTWPSATTRTHRPQAQPRIL
jgi:hypothetical protein